MYGHNEDMTICFSSVLLYISTVAENVGVNAFNSRCTVMPFLMCCELLFINTMGKFLKKKVKLSL
jgi:hypothetical protein